MLDPPAPSLSSRLPTRWAWSVAVRRASDSEISPARGRDQSTGTVRVAQSRPASSGLAQGCQAIRPVVAWAVAGTVSAAARASPAASTALIFIGLLHRY